MSLDINNYKKTKGVSLGSQWSIGDKKWFKWLGDFIQDTKTYITSSITSSFKDNSNVQSISANYRQLYASDLTQSVDWEVRVLYDGSEGTAIDWSNRLIHSTAGPVVLNFDVQANALTAEDNNSINSGDATTDAVIENMRTRIAELEERLSTYGLLAS